MMELTDTNDGRGFKTFKMQEVSEDRTSKWDIQLKSSDLPSEFENCNPVNRRVHLNVVDGSNTTPSDTRNAFYIPLLLVGMANIDDKIVCYYRTRHESEDDGIFSARISASIILGDGQSQPLDNPHLAIVFDVAKQDENGQGDVQSSQFQREPASPFVITAKNENAMGGKDIPLDHMTRPVEAGDRVVIPAE